MPRPPDPQRTKALLAIRQHVADHGAVEGPRLAKKLFPEVPKPTWSTWCKMVRDADRDLVEELRAIVPPPVQTLAPVTNEGRAVARRAIDFFAELDAMVADARLLADYASATNDDGTRRVKNPQMLAVSHRMRATNLALAMKYSEMVWSVERLEQMHDAIANAIHQADRETGERVFAAVKNVQRRWNLDRDS
ncbi:hypothetical protein OKW30_001185 [Paraburkholderia sp. Clong3]|uniref:hypothetical protein n=1 Tax=Paraburkholderia sp. Clong3 TaxID=2991061 RepID=UPI003D1B0C86